MGYYHVKNLKQVKTENGYNAVANIADSNISDWNNNLVWHENSILYKTDFKTKEELEHALFVDFLDGNLHGACGKYAPLNWRNNRVVLSDKETSFLNRLDTKFWSKYKKTQKYDTRMRDRYDKIRYNLYFRAWKKLLEEEKTIKYTITYKDLNVSSLTSTRIKYGYAPAKVFKGLPENNKNLQVFLKQYADDIKIKMC